jgi:hypothetical protein
VGAGGTLPARCKGGRHGGGGEGGRTQKIGTGITKTPNCLANVIGADSGATERTHMRNHGSTCAVGGPPWLRMDNHLAGIYLGSGRGM